MKNAVIYTRVSTDEQADKGFSLQHQETMLRNFCEIKKLNIIRHYQEDYSAKNFNRPEWINLAKFVKLNKKSIDTILFLRWDRLSRNVEESLRVIREFHEIGIELVSVENPIDMTNPDNLILLNLYLTIPEVENMKNKIRTTEGMREAKKQGFWVGSPPFGYSNTRTLEGKSTLKQNEKLEFVRIAFEMMSTGQYTCEEVRRSINNLGAKRCKQSFMNILNNIAYAGKIKIPENKKEGAQIVDGIHPEIIPISLYNQVQYILNVRRKQPRNHKPKSALLSLRGHLKCPTCNGNFTGSGSTGRNGIKHYYYHCQRGCPVRYRADMADEQFLAFLSTLKISASVNGLLKEIMRDIYKESEGDKTKRIKDIESEISILNSRIENTMDHLADNKITAEEYHTIKNRCEEKVIKLNSEIADIKMLNSGFIGFMEFSLDMMSCIDNFYSIASAEVKDSIVGSIFPEKVIFDGKKYRTTKMNEVINVITRKINTFGIGVKEKVGKFADLSMKAPPAGLEPATL